MLCFFPLRLRPHSDPTPLSGKHPKTRHHARSSPGDSRACRRDCFTLLPAVSAGNCVLKQLPEISPFLRFCPRAKQEGPDFPSHTPHRCLPPGTNPLLHREWGPQASSQQCQDKTPTNAPSHPHFEEIVEAAGFREGSDWLKQGAMSCSQLIVRYCYLIRTTLTAATNASAGPPLYKHHYKGAYKFSLQRSEQECVWEAGLTQRWLLERWQTRQVRSPIN